MQHEAPVNTPEESLIDLRPHFPLPAARAKQLKALDFLQKAISRGYRDIVVVAPTGGGKSAIGMALASWSYTDEAGKIIGVPGALRGAWYLVTQKMLQTQLEDDAPNYLAGSYAKRAVSIKAADNYQCHAIAGSCADKAVSGKTCSDCIYKAQKAAFLDSPVGITNYAYFLTERAHVGSIVTRRLLICDEAHNLEQEVIRAAEIELAEKDLIKYAPEIESFPNHRNGAAFVGWLSEVYLPAVAERAALLSQTAESNVDDAKDLKDAKGHIMKLSGAVTSFLEEKVEWVYWEGERENADDPRVQYLRPLKAAHFFRKTIQQNEGTRLYLSAYLGSKKTFCDSLGMNPDDVAWLSLGSEFPPENRKVRIIPVGSMSFQNKKATTPRMIKMVAKILGRHENQKGAIHSGSYALGKQVVNELRGDFGDRLLFPESAEERDEIFAQHRDFPEDPTVLVSPSMTEGYDFKYDLARFQMLLKCPYLYLKDAQVKARMEGDPKWYALRTAMTIIQSVGRGCRAPDDTCISYLLDSDFITAMARNPDLYPEWFTDAVKIVQKK